LLNFIEVLGYLKISRWICPVLRCSAFFRARSMMAKLAHLGVLRAVYGCASATSQTAAGAQCPELLCGMNSRSNITALAGRNGFAARRSARPSMLERTSSRCRQQSVVSIGRAHLPRMLVERPSPAAGAIVSGVERSGQHRRMLAVNGRDVPAESAARWSSPTALTARRVSATS
jgi:hypothetical protein